MPSDKQAMHLAQFNIARAKAPLDSPVMKEFVDNLVLINAIAETSEGFIWRLQDESGDATNIKLFDDPLIIINMSIWESIESLRNFVFRSRHLDFLKKKKLWFEKAEQPNLVLWWIPPGHIPSLEEAKNKLSYLKKHGETSHAFGMAGAIKEKT